eukprot:gnl/Spiro4/9012_TR4755_c0_g1_i1.p1 gnl/Spiro4/9012_TR4755_c0_g1~~gnl/Spiro4/9012_TR4755_c0_g1_i1.p1  ORF type:complete len:556 (+),score=58.89 gnl/Spiro4/9012_TR4755_c0_g1_i1:77-1744(+)
MSSWSGVAWRDLFAHRLLWHKRPPKGDDSSALRGGPRATSVVGLVVCSDRDADCERIHALTAGGDLTSFEGDCRYPAQAVKVRQTVLRVNIAANRSIVVSALDDTTVGAFGTLDGTLRWSVSTPLQRLVSCVALSPDGGVVACGASSCIMLCDARLGRCFRTLQHSSPISALYFATVPARCTSVPSNGDATGRCMGTCGAALGEDGTSAVLLISVSRHDETLHVWRVSDGCLIANLHCNCQVSSALAVSGCACASGSAWDGAVQLWCLAAVLDSRTPQTGESALSFFPQSTFSRHTAPITALKFYSTLAAPAPASQRPPQLRSAPRELLLVSASSDRTVRIWRVRDGACLHVLLHPAPVTMLALAARFGALATCSGRRVHVWNVDTGKPSFAIEHVRDITALKVSRHQIVTGSVDGGVRAWRLSRRATSAFNPRRAAPSVGVQSHHLADPPTDLRNVLSENVTGSQDLEGAGPLAVRTLPKRDQLKQLAPAPHPTEVVALYPRPRASSAYGRKPHSLPRTVFSLFAESQNRDPNIALGAHIRRVTEQSLSKLHSG